MSRLGGKLVTMQRTRFMYARKRGIIMSSQISNPDNQPGRTQGRREAVPNTLLRAARHRRSWTQQALADQLGTTPLAINRWEQGKAVPSAYFRTKICDLFGLTEAELGLRPHEPQAPQTALWLVPHRRNPFFTGRHELLEGLHALLRQEKTAVLTQSLALSGLGGIGKTQTAVEYAYRHAQEYSAIFWIIADTPESIVVSFSSIAELLDLPEKHESDQNKMLAAVSRWLVDHRDWLLILDNVEDIELIRRFLPPARQGSLLFTTRLQAFGALARPLEMERMTAEEGTQLLLRRSTRLFPSMDQIVPVDETLFRSIAESMDGLPLAIDQAGAYIDETQCSLSDYLQMYQAYPLSLLDERDGRSNHPASVVKTFAFAFAKVQLHNPGAAELLRLCSFLAPDTIPEELIVRGASQLGSLLQALVADPLQYNAALKALLAYSLIRRNPQTKTVTVHRLVQAVIREHLTAEERQHWVIGMLQALQHEFYYESMQTAKWPWCEQLLPHVLTVITRADAYKQITADLASLQINTAIYMRDRGLYTEGERLLTKAIQIQEETSGQDALDLARSLKELGVLYIRWGKFEQAEVLLQRSLQIQEQMLGSDRLEVADGLYTLAMLYGNWNSDEEAESLLKRALQIYKQQRGTDHIDVIKTLIALAILCSKEQTRYPEAESLLRQALATSERVLDERHYLVVTSLNNLGILYTYQQRYEEAEPLLERALGIWEQELGPDHPYTADPLGGLADVYKAKGAYEVAERYYQQSLRIRERTLGPDHPQAALSAYGLADLYRKWGKAESVEPLYKQALAVQMRQLGKDHQETARTLEDYRSFLAQNGREEDVTHLLM
jgi:tetratricopeptide (TPR) repeat protein/transcriptional regulator with XRE-family HTH domain